MSSKKKHKKKDYEQPKEHELLKAIDDGYFGKDIFYYLRFVADKGLKWPGIEETTEGFKIFVNFLRKVFDDLLKEKKLTEFAYQETLRDSKRNLEEKINLIMDLDFKFRKKLKRIFRVSDKDLEEALRLSQDFFREISNELKVADPRLTGGLYQDFALFNEVNNASLGLLLSLFLGYDTKVNPPEAEKLIRFEAGREILVVLKALAGIKRYRMELEKLRNGRLQMAVNQFFGPVIERTILQLDEMRYFTINIRKIDGQRLIVDEKPIKTFASFLRKSFEGPNIFDVFSVSVVILPQENQKSPTKNHMPETKLSKPDPRNLLSAFMIMNKFKNFLKEQFPDKEVRFVDVRTYGTKRYYSGEGLKQEEI